MWEICIAYVVRGVGHGARCGALCRCSPPPVLCNIPLALACIACLHRPWVPELPGCQTGAVGWPTAQNRQALTALQLHMHTASPAPQTYNRRTLGECLPGARPARYF